MKGDVKLIKTIAIYPSDVNVDLFWEKVKKGDKCWLWKGAVCAQGYGHFRVLGRARRAHRISYALENGSVPSGLTLDHLCRVRNCVNPNHLEPVTQGENVRRGESWAIHGKKTECPSGHPYDAANTVVQKNSHGSGMQRICRECSRRNKKKYQDKMRARKQI